MPRLLLDTTFLIDVLNDRGGRAELMERLILEQHALACCAINVAEVYVGLRAPESPKTEALLRQLRYVPIRWEAAKLAGDLRREWARKGQTLSLTDMLIAAVCLTEGLTLVTDNRRHFPMPELALFPLPVKIHE
jgi:predicted nucleic acid-binding protein